MSGGGAIGLARRAAGKPVGIILFRLGQAARLAVMRRLSLWQRAERRAARARPRRRGTTLFSADPPPLDAAQRDDLAESARRVLASDFPILGTPAPDLEHCDFSQDWRFGHCWEAAYFRTYRFYVPKKIPYDVKFPWELSRLQFLVPVMCAQAAGACDSSAVARVRAVLERWRAQNPLAHSVNWYPMEASMRLVTLVMLQDLATICLDRSPDARAREALDGMAALLARMIEEHLTFVWINREVTDVRGNHYTANLVALLLGGVARGRSPRWLNRIRRWIEAEVELQFLPDGVNFEKAAGYHKLVLELCLIAAIACDRMGAPLGEAARAQLRAAARFSDALTRLDGLAANIGDNDDATALPFHLEDRRSHAEIVQLVSAWAGEAIGTFPYTQDNALASVFLLGRQPPARPAASGPETRAFREGGFVVCRDITTGFFFICDIGEVGMKGRGGHGHNDLLSFELFLSGRPVVVDPGCSGYTADLARKVWYRGTAAHATVRLFGQEIARITGHWTIADDAVPLDVRIEERPGGVLVGAGHRGYARCAAGTHVSRLFDVDALEQRVEITDEIRLAADGVRADWSFPVGRSEVALAGRSALLTGTGEPIRIDSELELSLGTAPFSEGYGREETGRVLSAATLLGAGEHRVRFGIGRQAGDDA